MAKCTITFEDQPGGNGRVKVEMNPRFDQMIKASNSGHSLTAAEAYAVSCANHIRRVAAEQPGSDFEKKSGRSGLILPRGLGR